MNYTNVAIITARGGSKRLPRKNIKDFFGKPAISYAIQNALDTHLFDEVMVSTDDKEISDIALNYGAKIPFLRSENNSNDHATTSDVILEVIKKYQENGITIENICCIYPCSMLIKPIHLIESFNILNTNPDIGSVVPIGQYYPPTQRQLIIDGKILKFADQKFESARSQDLKTTYYDAGQFYWLKTKDFIKLQSIWQDGQTMPYPINPQHFQDIDDINDWEMAKIKYLFSQSQKNHT